MTFGADRLARLLVTVPTGGLMPLPLRHSASDDIGTRGIARRGVDLVTGGAVRSDALLFEMRTVFEIVLMRGGAERLVEPHRRSKIGVTVAATAQFLPRRMNVATVALLMAREAGRDHPVVETMTVAALRQWRVIRHFGRIEMRLMRKALESELIQRLRKISDRHDFLQAQDFPFAVANNAERTLRRRLKIVFAGVTFRAGIVIRPRGNRIRRIAAISDVALVAKQALVLLAFVIELRFFLNRRRDDFDRRDGDASGGRLPLLRRSRRPVAGDESQKGYLGQTRDNQF